MRNFVRRGGALALTGALALALTGCIGSTLRQVGPLGLIMTIFTGSAPSKVANKKKRKKKIKLKSKEDVEVTGSYGGLSGTYDIDVADYGNLEGVADIKGSFKAKIKTKDFDEAAAVVIEAAVLDRLDVEIDVTDTNIKYKGRQTRGGVKKIYNAKVKFEGTVASGENAGARVKGKLSFRGRFE